LFLSLLVTFSVFCCCSGKYDTKFIDGLKIVTRDGITLVADAFVPVPKTPTEVFPLLVFINSWGVFQFEYSLKSLDWARSGYVVIEYETRGFFRSGGQIGTAGPDDWNDFSDVLDWTLSQSDWHINSSSIASGGISYGAGLSLLGAEHDPRVTTVLALSGWGNLTASLYDNASPSLVWGGLLIAAADLFGSVPPDLKDLWSDMLNHQNISFLKSWSGDRSPCKYVDKLNERGVPVFLSNNFEDRIFKSSYIMDFYQQLDVPKMMLYNQGIHASAEIGGLADLPNNYIWAKAKLWIDYWLKGIDTGIMQEPALHFELRDAHKERITFSSWPAEEITSKRFYLYPRKKHFLELHKRGDLSTKPYMATGEYQKISSFAHKPASDSITFKKHTHLSAGIPIVGDLAQVLLHVPIDTFTPIVSEKHAILYYTDKLEDHSRLCGLTNLTLQVSSDTGSTHLSPFQIEAYLYELDHYGIAKLISDGPFTYWADEYDVVGRVDDSTVIINIRLRNMCLDIKKGHRIALGLDMYTHLYKTASEDKDLTLTIYYNENNLSYIEIPFVNL